MNTQKGFASVLLILLGLVVIGGGVYFYNESNSNEVSIKESTMVKTPKEIQKIEKNKVETSVMNIKSKEKKECGFTVVSILPNSEVSFPLTIKGIVDRTNYKVLGCSWQTFEGIAGIAQLYFNFGNQGWKPLGNEVPIFVDDWTATTTQFTSTLNFNNEGIGLPFGTKLKIVFTEENPAVINPSLTFELPLLLK